MSSTSYTNMWNVYNCAGSEANGGLNTIVSNIGEPSVSEISGGNYTLSGGFLAFDGVLESGPTPTPTPHHYVARENAGVSHRMNQSGNNLHVTEAGRISPNGEAIIIYSFFGNSAEDAAFQSQIMANPAFSVKIDIGINTSNSEYKYVTGTAGW